MAHEQTMISRRGERETQILGLTVVDIDQHLWCNEGSTTKGADINNIQNAVMTFPRTIGQQGRDLLGSTPSRQPQLCEELCQPLLQRIEG